MPDDSAATILDRQLEASIDSNETHVLRNTITALTAIGGPARMELLTRLLERLASLMKRPGADRSRYKEVYGYALEKARAVPAADKIFLKKSVEESDRERSGRHLGPILWGGRAQSFGNLWSTRSLFDGPPLAQRVSTAFFGASGSFLLLWFAIAAFVAAVHLDVNLWGLEELAAVATFVLAPTIAVLAGSALATPKLAGGSFWLLIGDALVVGMVTALVLTVILLTLPAGLAVRGVLIHNETAWSKLPLPLGAVWLVIALCAATARAFSRLVIDGLNRSEVASQGVFRPIQAALAGGGIVAVVVSLLFVSLLLSWPAGVDWLTMAWLLSVPTIFATACSSVLIENAALAEDATEKSGPALSAGPAIGIGLAATMVLIAVAIGPATSQFMSRAHFGSLVLNLQPRSPLSTLMRTSQLVELTATARNTNALPIRLTNGAQTREMTDSGDQETLETSSSLVTFCPAAPSDAAASIQLARCRPGLSWLPALFRMRSNSSAGPLSVAIRQLPPVTLGLLPATRDRVALYDSTQSTNTFAFSLTGPTQVLIVPVPGDQPPRPPRGASDALDGPFQIAPQVFLEQYGPDGSPTPVETNVARTRNMGMFGILPEGHYRVCIRLSGDSSVGCTVSLQYAFVGRFAFGLRSVTPGMAMPTGDVTVSQPITPNGATLNIRAPSLVYASFRGAHSEDVVLDLDTPMGSDWGSVGHADSDNSDHVERLLVFVAPGSYRLCGRRFGVAGACGSFAGTLAYSVQPFSPGALPALPPPELIGPEPTPADEF